MTATLDEKDQKTLIELMLGDSNVFTRVRPILKPIYFDKKFHRTIEYLLDFSNTYNTLPSVEQLNTESRIEYSPILAVKDNVGLQKSVLDSVEAFCKQQALEQAIINAADKLNKGVKNGIDTEIKEAQMISVQRDLGIDFWEKQEEWLRKIDKEMGQITTGFKSLDDLLDGGLNWGTLNYVVSAAGGGKSLFLANLGLNMSLNGFNVLYITLELDQELVGKRIMSMASNIPYKNITTQESKVIDSLLMRKKEVKPGIFRIANMRNGCTPNEMEALVQELEIFTNQAFQVVIIDYADIMRANDSRINPENIHLQQKSISEDLRGFARERTHTGKNTLVFTASQISKENMDELEYSMSTVAGSSGKSHTADLIMSVRTNLAMKQRGEYMIQMLKCRNSGGVDKKLKIKYNVDTLLMSDMEEVQANNPFGENQQNVNSAVNTLNKLKQLTSKG